MMAGTVKAPRILYHMVRADFLERVRRYSFLATLAGALYVAYGVAAEKVWIVVGNGYRGAYNSAWIGMLMAICCSTFLSLAGFYIVKNSVQRDTDTRVGQILAATPMRKDFYTIAKTISNFAVLACMVVVLMLAAVVMQRVQGTEASFSLWKLWAPFIFFALPTMLLTASLALLFETIPFLRGGLGNVIYFFVWTAALMLGVSGFDDASGMQLLYRSTRNALSSLDPAAQQKFSFSLTIGGEHAVRTFPWEGIDWTVPVLLMRLFWIAVATGTALLAALFFHRFDPARSWGKHRTEASAAVSTLSSEERPQTSATIPSASIHLTPLPRTPSSSRFLALLISECRLMLKGRRWWWYTVASGLVIASLASPRADVRGGLLVAAWLWPIFGWSQMGCRDAQNSTRPLILSSERSLSRQLPALWTAGVLVALLAGCGTGIRLLMAFDWHGLAGWLAGALFIPSLALSLGIWTGGSKAFEAIYIVWWYVGPAHQMPGLDFMGTTPASSSPALYGSLAAVLVALAYWRRRQELGYA